MLPKQAATDTALVIPTGNPFAKFLVCLFAKFVGVLFVPHFAASPNVMYPEKPAEYSNGAGYFGHHNLQNL
jgi:hypothetical protein